jgi:hypothetical protein
MQQVQHGQELPQVSLTKKKKGTQIRKQNRFIL